MAYTMQHSDYVSHTTAFSEVTYGSFLVSFPDLFRKGRESWGMRLAQHAVSALSNLTKNLRDCWILIAVHQTTAELIST